ncbi:MAG: transporter substrate-binding domain-containing protein [Streptosporangiales bacterium]|nr:transporter substrate-binding domain-containing protein [Streptosporangiales bacterium]
MSRIGPSGRASRGPHGLISPHLPHQRRWFRVRLLHLKVTLPLSILGLLLAGCIGGSEGNEGQGGQAGGQQGNTLQRVQDRGTLNCGINDAVPGFGVVTPQGEYEGFDIDYCRAVAAAVLGDPNAVEFKPVTTEQRFTALQSGEIDVLIRNTTWTAERDGAEGATFLHTTFYDGQGMMVPADSDYRRLEDMDGTTICVLSGTTTELNLATAFRARNLEHEPLSFEDNETLQQAFQQGRCDGWTSDKSQLAGVRSSWPDNQGGPDALRILDEEFSKEPLGPVVRDGDSPWAQAIDWTVIATIQAEEFGITSENVEQMKGDQNEEIRRLLGEENFDSGLGLPDDFAVQVIQAVGNYGEIYDRNVGADSPLGLERGLNDLYTNGGLHYAPPYR